MTTISGTSQTSQGRLSQEIAHLEPPPALSGAAGEIAQVGARLEEVADRADQQSRRERRTQSVQRRASIKDSRRAANFELAGALVSAGAQASGALLKSAGHSKSSALSTGAGDSAAALVTWGQKRASADSKLHDAAADEAAARASDQSSTADRARAAAEKALGRVDSVQDTIHRARMEAIGR